MYRDNRIVYFCKSDIDKNWVYFQKHGFAGCSRTYLKNMFDDYIYEYGEDDVRLTGSKTDKKKQRHTKFVSLYAFYRFCFKLKDR